MTVGYSHEAWEGHVCSAMSRPDSRPDLNDGSEPSSGPETIYWDSLPDFFFFFLNPTGTCGYGSHPIT